MIFAFLGCTVASREKTKYRFRPMTTKLHFTVPQWSYSYYFTCLISLDNQCWTNWVLTEDHSALILQWSNKNVSQRIILCSHYCCSSWILAWWKCFKRFFLEAFCHYPHNIVCSMPRQPSKDLLDAILARKNWEMSLYPSSWTWS